MTSGKKKTVHTGKESHYPLSVQKLSCMLPKMNRDCLLLCKIHVACLKNAHFHAWQYAP